MSEAVFLYVLLVTLHGDTEEHFVLLSGHTDTETLDQESACDITTLQTVTDHLDMVQRKTVKT